MVELIHTCEGHTLGVSFIAWSPDALHILALGPDESSDVWIWNAEVRLGCNEGVVISLISR